MPMITDHADRFRDWESLIEAVVRNAARLPGFEPVLDTLQDFLAQAKDAKAEQEQQMGLRKAMTQQLDFLLDRGEEAARKVRRFVLLHYDSRDEQLTQFGIKPFRTRVRRTATAASKPAPEEPKPAPEESKAASEESKAAPEAADPSQATASAPAIPTDEPAAAEPAK